MAPKVNRTEQLAGRFNALGGARYFTMGKIGKLGKRAPRFGETLKPSKPLFHAPTKADRCAGLVATDVLESVKKLSASRRRESDSHVLGLVEEFVGLSQHGIEAGALAGLNLPISAGQGS